MGWMMGCRLGRPERNPHPRAGIDAFTAAAPFRTGGTDISPKLLQRALHAMAWPSS